MSPERRYEGNVFRMGPKRPNTGVNPMEDPFEAARRVYGPDGVRLRRARDRVEFQPMDVHAIRAQFHQTRAEFAHMLGISKETLRNWERGRRFPQGPARALLRIAAANPDVVAAVLVRRRVTWAKGWRDPYDREGNRDD